LIRSYLGKAFFEEKRIGLDEREYQIAKELDPNDPTPHFYSAIAKQTTNRPVEALRDFETAKELNDNRAVYRSRLLLDSDLAARSAATARIFNDLGFGQRGLLEGYKAVNADPTNFSAHRFLADTYSVLPRHEIARVSELLQSQLLQPSNMTPIQPSLAESNLFLISSGGAANTSFNEFNPLFNRDRVALQASGLVGENSTWAGEGIVSGINKKLSFSAGYSYYETDGFRVNNDQEDKIGNVFAQYELSPKTSIQAEYRYRDTSRGDIRQRFFKEDFLTDLRLENTVPSGRFGFRHSFSPGSILIGNFQYAKGDEKLLDLFFIDPEEFGVTPPDVEDLFEVMDEQTVYGNELSYLFRSKNIDLVAGAGYFKIDQTVTFTDTIVWPGVTPPEPLDFFSDSFELDTNHYNFYGYTYIKPFKDLTLTVGASGDIYDQEDKTFGDENMDTSQFNPKFGVIWNPFVNTTLRGGVFRTFKRTLVTNQTLEPTQVSGFNQFFDDPDATDVWVYGGAIDQKLLNDIYLGGEIVYRDLNVPFFSQAGPGAPIKIEEVDWKEYLGRFYAYWTPHKWMAFSAEYQYEKIERDEQLTQGIKKIKTHRVPLGVMFYHPSGLSAGLKATYYHQEGDIERTAIAFGLFQNDKDDFWLVDAAINYRLPKRYGFIALGVKNLFDKEFNYFDIAPSNTSIQQGRQAFIKFTLAVP
jgi:hypothetical protein